MLSNNIRITKIQIREENTNGKLTGMLLHLKVSSLLMSQHEENKHLNTKVLQVLEGRGWPWPP